MKKAKTFVHEPPSKRMERPRTVGDNGDATAVTVRLSRAVLAQVDKWAEKGVKRSDAIREMVTYAIAGRMINGAKTSRKEKR